MKPEDIKKAWEEKLNERTPNEEIKKQIRNVIRAVRLFNSRRDIIVCMGLLKSGKSTLVNLLTRNKHASPTEQGKDKTLRPSLIRMLARGEKAAIHIYYSTNDDRNEPFKSLIDYLCGIRDDLPKSVKEKYEPFEPRKLEEILCRQADGTKYLEKEPLLVVIDLEYNDRSNFFRNGHRMLMDMPGCDSGHAEVSQGDTYTRIGDECAMILLLQTTNQALNGTAIAQLKSLLKERSESTVCILQNRIDSKTWRTKENVETENNRQANQAIREIREIYPKSSPKSHMINLAMATDSLFADDKQLQKQISLYGAEYKNRDDLWSGSRFEEMETTLVGNLTAIRETHCDDRLKKELQELREVLKAAISSCQKEIDDRRQLIHQWENLCAYSLQFIEEKKKNPDIRTATFQLKEKIDFARLCENTWLDDNSIKTGENLKTSGKDIDACMTLCNNKCLEAFYKKLGGESGKISLRDLLINLEDKSDTAAGYAETWLKKALRELMTRLQKEYPGVFQEIEENEKPLPPEPEDYYIVIRNEKEDEIRYRISKQFEGKEKEKILIFFRRTVNKTYEIHSENPIFKEDVLNPMREHYEHLQNNLNTEEIATALKRFIEEKLREIIKSFTDDYIRKNRIEKLNRELNESQDNMKTLQQLEALAQNQLKDLQKTRS